MYLEKKKTIYRVKYIKLVFFFYAPHKSHNFVFKIKGDKKLIVVL